MARERKSYSIEELLNKAQNASEDAENETTSVQSTVAKSQPVQSNTIIEKVEEVEQLPSQPEPVKVEKNVIDTNNQLLDKNNIKRIIEIYKKYNSFEESLQKTVCNFLQVEFNNEVDLIDKVLTLTESDTLAMIDIANLRKEDSLSRAFSIMALSNDRLQKVNELTMLFSREFTQPIELNDNTKIEFSRNLEKGISSLPEQAVNFLKPMGELFELGR